jgi:hypothetical protein
MFVHFMSSFTLHRYPIPNYYTNYAEIQISIITLTKHRA